MSDSADSYTQAIQGVTTADAQALWEVAEQLKIEGLDEQTQGKELILRRMVLRYLNSTEVENMEDGGDPVFLKVLLILEAEHIKRQNVLKDEGGEFSSLFNEIDKPKPTTKKREEEELDKMKNLFKKERLDDQKKR